MTDQITQLLDDVQRLDQSAQPGPWMHNGTEGEVGVILGAPVKFGSFEEYPQITGFLEGEVDNGEFIALSRTALPKLASVITEILAFVEFAEKTHTENDEFDLAARSCIRAIKDAIKNGMEADGVV